MKIGHSKVKIVYVLSDAVVSLVYNLGENFSLKYVAYEMLSILFHSF